MTFIDGLNIKDGAVRAMLLVQLAEFSKLLKNDPNPKKVEKLVAEIFELGYDHGYSVRCDMEVEW